MKQVWQAREKPQHVKCHVNSTA